MATPVDTQSDLSGRLRGRILTRRALAPAGMALMLCMAMVPAGQATAAGRAAAASHRTIVTAQAIAAGQQTGKVARPHGYDPLGAQKFFMAQRAAPYGQIPAGALTRAQQQRTQFAAAQQARIAAQPNVVGASWSLIGPAPARGVTTGTNFLGPYGDNAGRITALAYDGPGASHNVLYAGTENGGVWKWDMTANPTTPTWVPLTDNAVSLAVGALAVVPGGTAATDTIYVGTGEANNNYEAYYSAGILRSTNGGATFTLLPNSATIWGGGHINGLDNRVAIDQYISKIVVDPNNPTHILVGSSIGVWLSTDSGATYTQTLFETNPGFTHTHVSDLLFDNSNPGVVYAALGYPLPEPYAGIYKSTTGGATWTTTINSPLGTGYPTGNNIGRIALGQASNGRLYMTAENPGAPSVNGSSLGVWTSADQGATWVQVSDSFATDGPDLFGDDAGIGLEQGWYDIYIAVDPNDATSVFVGGINVFHSTNGGCTTANCLTFTDTTNVYTTNSFTPHPDEHAFAFIGNPSVFWAGNDGGVYSTANAGTTWTDQVGTMNTIEFYAGSANQNFQANPVAFGGAQDNGTSKYTGNPIWNQVNGGDGGFTANENTSNPQVVYSEYTNLFLTKSTDGGATWANAINGIVDRQFAGFIAPYIMDKANSNHLLAGTDVVNETVDGANNWKQISPVLSPTGFISALAIAPGTNAQTTYYAGTSDGFVWKSTNHGQSWTDITAGTAGTAGRYVTSIAADPGNNPNDVVVTFSGFANSTGTGTGTHVFRSLNGGMSWFDISLSLPDSPVNSVLRNPFVPDAFYIGGDVGFYYTVDGGATWTLHQAGLPNSPINQLFADGNFTTILAATAGRGMAALPSDALNVVTGCTLTAALGKTPGAIRLGAAGSTQPSFPLGYITYQAGIATFVVSQPVAVTCPAFSVASSTISISGTIRQTKGGRFNVGDLVTVTFTYDPLSLFVGLAYGKGQPTRVEVQVTPGVGSSTAPYDVVLLPPYSAGSNIQIRLF